MISPTRTHCTSRAVREASNTDFSRTPEELDLPIDATACIYGTIFARLKTGCSHSPSQICGSIHTSKRVLASATATFEKLLTQTSCMTCLKRQIKACSCGERNGQGTACANFATSSFSTDVCVSVGSFCRLSSSGFWDEFPSPL